MITTINRRVIYTGDGANADFAYAYKVHADSHLKVYVDGVDSSISVYGRNADQESSPGGTLTMAVAPGVGTTVVVVREMPHTQTTDYTAYGKFPSDSHEARLDELAMSIQEHDDILSRTQSIDKEDIGLANFEMPTGVLDNTATTGFFFMPTVAGPPTGVPVVPSSKVAMVYDTTNNVIYVYNGGWKATVALT